MLFDKRKIIKVELINHKLKDKEPKDSLDIESCAKRSGYIAILISTGLLITGFMQDTAVFEAYGISTSEVTLSFQEMMTRGYLALYEFCGTMLGKLPITVLSFIFSYLVILPHRFKKEIRNRYALITVALGVALITPIYLPIAPYIPAQKKVLSDMSSFLGVEPGKLKSADLMYEQIFVTSEGSIRGELVFSDNDHTFFRAGDTIYKVRNSNNKVQRKTRIWTNNEAPEALPPK